MSEPIFRVSVEWRLLDRYENDLGTLQGVENGSGSVAWSAAKSVKSDASLTIRDIGQVSEWSQVRVQPVLTVNGDTWPLGVFIPSIPEWSYTDGQRRAEVNLVDKTSILAGDYFAGTHGVEKGTVVTDAVRDIIDSTGEDPGSITDAPDALSSSIEWDLSDSKLKAVNTLLDAANFFSLATNGNGRFVVRPYVKPANRAVRARFRDGEHGVRYASYEPGFKVNQDLGGVPNVYVAISQGDGDEESLYAEAVNSDPDDPLSTVGRGYRKLPDGGPDTDVKTTSQQGLQDYANRRLIELSDPREQVVITHPPRQIDLNDAVEFRSELHNIEGTFTVQRIEWSGGFSDQMTTTLRRLVNL